MNLVKGVSVKPVWLESGGHRTREEGVCGMEFASYLAGEAHSPHPQCVSRPLTTVMIMVNDALDPEDRQRTKPHVVRTLGTRDDGQDEERCRRANRWFELAGITGLDLQVSGFCRNTYEHPSHAVRRVYMRTHPEECFALIESILDPAGIHDVNVDAAALETAYA